jgi:ribosomal protein S18 acetylase RimI-like enzyme
MVLVRVKIPDLNELQDICIRAYAGNFSDHWLENGLELFLEEEFGIDKLAKDLREEFFTYYFISVGGEVRGFLKVDYNLPISEYPEKSSELVKIYVLAEYKGKGYGSAAMLELIRLLRGQGKENLFLYVINSNLEGIAFYKKMGFSYYGKFRLEAPFFREELRDMDCMRLTLDSR